MKHFIYWTKLWMLVLYLKKALNLNLLIIKIYLNFWQNLIQTSKKIKCTLNNTTKEICYWVNEQTYLLNLL